MLDFLPDKIKSLVLGQFKYICELRLRVGLPMTVTGSNGTGIERRRVELEFTQKDAENIVLKLSNFSIFSVEESLKLGFITSNDGERVGVCGDIVNSPNGVLAVKNFSSLCVRFPRNVNGCAKDYISRISEPKSCLVVSPPFHGKTTFIRDLARAYSDKFHQNVLFLDERDELSAGGSFYLGKNVDLLRYASKDFGFKNGVRAYNPDVIVCDEIMSCLDAEGVKFALDSGVKVVATAHGFNMENILKKQEISMILQNSSFQDVIFLQDFKIKKIYGDGEWLK